MPSTNVVSSNVARKSSWLAIYDIQCHADKSGKIDARELKAGLLERLGTT